MNYDIYLLCKGNQRETFERAKWKAWHLAHNDNTFVCVDSAKVKQTAAFPGFTNVCGQYEKHVIVNVVFSQT